MEIKPKIIFKDTSANPIEDCPADFICDVFDFAEWYHYNQYPGLSRSDIIRKFLLFKKEGVPVNGK